MKKVVTSLTNNKYNMRTLKGIVNENEITKADAEVVIQALFSIGAVTPFTDNQGKIFYRYMQHTATAL